LREGGDFDLGNFDLGDFDLEGLKLLFSFSTAMPAPPPQCKPSVLF